MIFLFSEFINIVFILFYDFIEFVVLLYTLLVICFAQYKKYMIWQISFSKFSDALLAFICASNIDNVWSIYLIVDILNLSPWIYLYLPPGSIKG